jgi:ADP-L-glycero-D-manno-heptose 6-epimerase
MKGRILVTGAAGMIGSAVIWDLNRRGYQNIVAVDRLGTSPKWENLVPLTITDYWEAEELLARLNSGALRDIGTVFHLGACSATTEQDGTYLMRNNFGYTKMLAHWAVDNGARFVYASSAATYGARERGLTEDLPLNELRPLNRYGYSKHLFDVYAQEAGLLAHIVGLKYFNVFGPNEDHKGGMRSVVYKAFHQIRETGKVQLFKSYRAEYPDGGQQRDFLYLKDAVDATLYLGESGEANGLFNVGSGQPHTWLELVSAVFKAMGREPEIEFIEMPDALREQYQYFTCAELGKLRGAGYSRPWTPLEEAVRDYVQGYLITGAKLAVHHRGGGGIKEAT